MARIEPSRPPRLPEQPQVTGAEPLWRAHRGMVWKRPAAASCCAVAVSKCWSAFEHTEVSEVFMGAKSRADTRADIVTLELFTRRFPHRCPQHGSAVLYTCNSDIASAPPDSSASSVEAEDPSVPVQACSSSAAGAYLGCSCAHLGHTKLSLPSKWWTWLMQPIHLKIPPMALCVCPACLWSWKPWRNSTSKIFRAVPLLQQVACELAESRLPSRVPVPWPTKP